MLMLALFCLTAAVLTGIYAYQTSQKNLQITRSAETLQRSFQAEKLRLENEKTQSALILHHLNEGVIGVDANQRILFINPSAAAILRVNSLSAADKTLIEVTHNTHFEEAMAQALRNQSSLTAEIDLTYPEEKNLRVSLIGLPPETGLMRGIAVFYDISQIKRLENTRREFVANVSHELKTPLTSIHGFIETLLGGALKDSAQSQSFLTMMREDTERLNRLIHSLLELSRIESREGVLKTEPLILKDEIEKTLTVLTPRIEEKKIEVKIQIPDSLPKIAGDRDQLKQVFLNLLENAVKFNREGGRIEISASEKKPFVEIRVRDTGIGIPQESVPRVFERFYRVDKSRTSQTGGSGLGLSIVKHIIEAHGGQIRCESTPSQGSVFSFTLKSV